MKKSRWIWTCALALTLAATLMHAPGSAAPQDRRIAHERYISFEVEVVVEGRALEVLYGRGRRYVEARDGAEYEVVVHNPLPVRVAVALSVDGLSTIDARRSSSWDASKWVIEPYGTIRISGWQMSSNRARRFYFTTERDSYASKLGRASDLGVITAVFYREERPRPRPIAPPPYDYDEESVGPRDRSEAPSERRAGESSANKSKSSHSGAATAQPHYGDDNAATGIGRSVNHDVTWVQMRLERTPAAEVTTRYEFRDALVRLGVLPRHTRDDNALRRRERSRGFEDPRYSPEP